MIHSYRRVLICMLVSIKAEARMFNKPILNI